MPLEDTIIALSTAPGAAARGILRISGPQALSALRPIFRPIFHGVDVPKILEGDLIPWGESCPIPAKLLCWPDGCGYTGRESVEIHTIGSPPLLDAVLSTVLNTSPKRRQGAVSPGSIRLARPGEFTLRAFLSGRIDLTRAEAVLGVIDATSKKSLETALKQLAGDLATPLRQAREWLLETLAHWEAGLDFPDEEIEFITRDEMDRSIRRVLDRVESLRARMEIRSLSAEIPVVVLAGPPNSGKSTLFNVLVGSDRALVSSSPGTTRDYLEAKVRFGEVSCLLVDTAGIDETRLDEIDDRARRLSTAAIENAGLVLYCNATSRAANLQRAEDLQRAENLQRAGDCVPGFSLNIRTKSDLPNGGEIFPDEFSVSAKTGFGIEFLCREIATRLARTSFSGDVVPSTATRCRDALDTAVSALRRALKIGKESMEDESFLASELRVALNALGLVDGSVHAEDILDCIFDRFCIGK